MPFELILAGVKLGLVLIALVNSDQVLDIPKVQFRWDPCSEQPVKHRCNRWERILVPHRGSSVSSVLHTQLEAAIQLLHKYNRCCRGR